MAVAGRRWRPSADGEPSSVPILPTIPTPRGLPTVNLMVEAALLEPAFCVTFSGHHVMLQVNP